MRRTILLDADIIAYKTAAVAEERYDFNGDGDFAVAVDEQAARARVDELIEEYSDVLKADSVVICFTDPHQNFRKQLEPSYKKNREKISKPVLLSYVKDYLGQKYESYVRPRLEADDVMGILATHPRIIPGEKVIVSEDKDMRTIPAKIYNPNYAELGVIEVSELDADRFHMWQTLCGDSTDGYPGCPGIGPKSVYAEEVISAEREELWDIVVEAYCLKGFTEADAIHQARLSRILRWYDYNYKTKTIKLWEPFFLY
tara:strand:- start:7292 stop:8062 length:771 start_codon:yes stop_codon:yes gene_type:complete